MGLFDKIFKNENEGEKKENTVVPWNELTSIEQLDSIKIESEEQYVAILKHSTRCGVSRMVLRMFESDYNLPEDAPVKLYFLDLIAHRDVSNAIAEKFGVRHESPQLIIIKDAEVVHHASHQQIEAGKLKELVG
ncbi:bacillithiol system redox-active protein YtxJ [Christiangramia fulva]|uniref:Bacillithiol system redox-active protein YtxJ n=1 Tax=Christiangramia fulva TaxID=2126553 RepID=A0A2R3Z6E9_9FLAO|nr:bacillithiol system redox-active protein YtxJ [Christiangramia fulva]AVR45835.1 bacillithiol system redox-active protein YtxJ [Christiangramia fulva]